MPTKTRPVVRNVPAPPSLGQALLRLIGTPDLGCKRWIWEQYDHLVTGQTLQRPGGDAAVVRLEGRHKALAMTTDCTPRYCEADPETGGAQAVVESYRNLCAVGARPLAVTDNLNFGNPEKPEIMGQLVGCIAGMGAACRALDYPIISGNVSLYNETDGVAILPTPVIGGVGVIEDATQAQSLAFKRPGDAILVIGSTEGWLGCSLYLRDIAGREEGAPPPLDLAAEKRHGSFVRALIGQQAISAAHDVGDGGLLVAIAEMALAGNLGAELTLPPGIAAHEYAFGEDQGRYVVTAQDAAPVVTAAATLGIPVVQLGTVGGIALTVNGGDATSLVSLRQAHEGWLPAYMGAAHAAAE